MKCNRWTLRADKADILRWLQCNELNRSHPTFIGLSQVMFTTNESDLVSSLAYIEKNISLKQPRLGSLHWAKCFKRFLCLFCDTGYLACVQLTCDYYYYFLFQHSRKCMCTTIFIDVFAFFLFCRLHFIFSSHWFWTDQWIHSNS